jgi:S-adenosylmethionine:tRNA ribosyltransferase-isomerase
MTSLDDYDYFLPKKNLALEPAVPRDSSKLFIYNVGKDKIMFDHFYNLDKYLPKDSFMVMNNTKVLPARAILKKESGGKVILLFLVNELGVMSDELLGGLVKVMADRKITIGERVFFDQENYLKVVGQNENIFELKFDFGREKLFELLKKYGTMPIPPYLKKSTLTRDELLIKYQTIFAKTNGSAAAPTASLHFTDDVFKKLDEKGINRFFVTLHVGMGTFAPITDENIKEKKLHNEFYEIDENTWKQIKINRNKEKKLVAVGTTVVRTLETAINNDSVRQFLSHESLSLAQEAGSLSKVKKLLLPRHTILDKTDLFIFPPYNFKMVDAMITNFHLPKSSLMMLVEAFLQHKKAKKSLVELYNIAIKNDFRFYSFGDAMVIV